MVEVVKYWSVNHHSLDNIHQRLSEITRSMLDHLTFIVMKERLPIHRWIDEFLEGSFDKADVKTQIDAGWYD